MDLATLRPLLIRTLYALQHCSLVHRNSRLMMSSAMSNNSDSTSQTEFWQAAFDDKQLMWGLEPCESAIYAADYFAKRFKNDAGSSSSNDETERKKILIPGIGYGRNAKPFLSHNMVVTGIEISKTAIDLARSKLGFSEEKLPIYHGSVEDMPFNQETYDGIFVYGLIYLLDATARRKLIQDCYNQLQPDGYMIFTVISKKADFYGQGTPLGEDYFERMPGLKMYFYDANSVEREFGLFGLVEQSEMNEPHHGNGAFFPFINVVCQRK
ncbi:hypothetical protein MPSEU_000109200 [Mayamaea pseudoterrestris]|nr:hypothetical protein MPSEU_000109200 [Mayamaea pseudoterrestris]